MPYSNEALVKKEAEAQRERIQTLKLNAVKLGIHASERVLTNLIDRSFDYQEKVDCLLVQAIGAENGERFITLAEMQLKFASQIIAMAEGLMTRVIDLEAAKAGLTSQ